MRLFASEDLFDITVFVNTSPLPTLFFSPAEIEKNKNCLYDKYKNNCNLDNKKKQPETRIVIYVTLKSV